MPSQLVKCAFGFRSFNGPKAKCVPLSLELGSEQGGTCPRCPQCRGPWGWSAYFGDVTFWYWGDDFKIFCSGEFLLNVGERNFCFLDLGMVRKIIHLLYSPSVFDWHKVPTFLGMKLFYTGNYNQVEICVVVACFKGNPENRLSLTLFRLTDELFQARKLMVYGYEVAWFMN